MDFDTESRQFQRAWAKILGQAWADPSLRARLVEDPIQVLREQGIDLPADAELRIDDSPMSELVAERLGAVRFTQGPGASTVGAGRIPFRRPGVAGATAGSAGTFASAAATASLGTACATAASASTLGRTGS